MSSSQSTARGAGPRSASAELSEPTSEGRAPSPLARAEQFGRYRLCFELASGGMATVYLAHAGGPGRFQKYVALKRIHAHLASRRDFVEMFHDEAAIAARISHPNVAAVFDFGAENGVHYLAMEYLIGEPLIRLLRACRKQPAIDWSAHARIIARVVADVCEGLHAAHELQDEQGQPLDVVHRDVSPDNVFVTYDGVVKLVDFGVASARNRITHTTTGVLKGKHAYMAPELLSEDGFDRRADIFSAGVVLWEALTLRRLFRRESEAKTLFAVIGDPIPPPSQKVPELAPELDAIVMRALARDPEERYATARELARDLRGYLLDQRADVTAADIEAWAAALSPDGLAQRRALLAGVDRIVAEAEAIPASDDADPTRVERVSERPSPPRRAAGPRAWLGAIALIGALAIGALVWSQYEPAAAPAASAPAEPIARSEPPREPRVPEALAVETAPATDETTTGETTTGETTTGETTAHETTAHETATREAARREPGSESPTAGAPEPAPRRRPRASAAPSGEHGELRIGLRARSGGSLPDDAWAEVRIDGRAVEGSPPLSLRLPPGRHVVEVRPYGTRRGLTRSVDVEPGERSIAIFEIEER